MCPIKVRLGVLLWLCSFLQVGCSSRLAQSQLSVNDAAHRVEIKSKRLFTKSTRFCSYDFDGTLQIEGFLSDTTRIGRWKFYSDGNLVQVITYDGQGNTLRMEHNNYGQMFSPDSRKQEHGSQR